MSLLFEDHFDGGALDLNKWAPYNSAGHAGHGWRKPRAFTVANSVLTCTGRMETVNDKGEKPLAGEATYSKIVSGGMSAKKDGVTLKITYGRLEAMVRTDPDPAGVMSGVLITYRAPSTSKYGENDYYETGHAANSRNPFYSYIHRPYGTSGGDQAAVAHPFDASQWHLMAMDWRQDHIAIYRDGAEVWRTTDPTLIPTQPMQPTVQLDAMIDGVALTKPVRLQVDYLRVWS